MAVIAIGAACFTLSGCRLLDDSNEKGLFAYALRLEPSQLKKYGHDAFVDQIDLESLEIKKSYKVDTGVHDITYLDERTLLLSFYREIDFYYHKVQRLDLKWGIIKKLMTTEGSGPRGVIPFQHKYYVRIDEMKMNSPQKGMAPYQRGGFEIFSRSGDCRLAKKLYLGEDDHIVDLDLDSQSSQLYMAIRPFDVLDARYPKGKRINSFGDSSIYIIDTKKDTIVQKQDVSLYLRGILGIEVAQGNLYVTAAYTKDYDGNLHGESHRKYVFEKQYPDKIYEFRHKFKSYSNRDLFVFDLDTFEKKSTISLGYKAGSMEYDSLTGYLLVEEDRYASPKRPNLITVIDTKTNSVKKTISIPGYHMMSLVADGIVFITSEQGLYVLNLNTLTIDQSFIGFYDAIAVRY